MATKAKKPAVKKTAKKPATKSVAKTSKTVVSRKVAKKSAPKKSKSKPSVAVTTKVTRSKVVLTPLERIRSTHLSVAITSVFFAVMTAFFVGSASSEIMLASQARDAFTNTESVVLSSASEVLFSLEYKYILIAILAFSAVGSLLLATKLRTRYELSVKSGVSGFRWLLVGLTAGLTLQLVSFIGGVQDLMTLKLIGALIVATVLLGWVADRDNATSKKPKWLAFIASLYTGALAWFPLVGSMIGTTVYGSERFGWHVYALAGVALAGFTGFAVTQYLSIKNKNSLEYTVYEQRYLRIDQLTKFLVVVIVFSAFAK